jgi:amino acid transporter
MPGDGQRGPGSGGTADRGRPGAGQARQDAGRDSRPGDGQDYAGTPRPDALIPALDEGQLAALREVGREWDRVSADPQVWRQALPVDPSLGEYPEASQVRPALFTRFVPVAGRDGQLPPIQTTSVSETPLTPAGRAGQGLRRLVFGPPLDASALAVERMRKLVALPVLSADALSSVAYGPQAMLAVLVLAGLPGLSYSLPVGAAIVVLMLAVGVSYRQTIRAYPQGGGSYIVASEELGRVPGLMAAAGLLIDYVMTVAVSIASGVAAITSAYPPVQPATVWIGVGVIVILLAGNLRGVRQAGAVFAVPTYAFIAAIAALVAAGLVHAAGRGFHPVPVRHLAVVQAVTVLLVLRAFASGATAMTGIEAISNAVPSFKPAEWRNAQITLSWMIGLLIGMFSGILVITRLAGIVPVASQTMLSQLAHLSFGDGPVYVFVQAATAAVLLMAANTSYNDFPRVLFLMARDRQAPRSFLHIGDRLTFSEGILLLSVTSAAIYIVFRGNTGSLLPLYAVGVFLAFTLSQTGMIMHWRRHRDQPHWRRSLAFNATGAVLSGIVFVIEGVTKFTEGAWVSLVLIAAITVTALHTRRYYVRTGRQLALRAEEAATPAALPAKVAPLPPSSRPARGPEGAAAPGSEAEGAEQPGQINALTIVPVEVMDRAGLQALAYAAALGQPAFALHISPTAEEADRFLGYWRAWGDHLPLEVIVSPHRAVVAPLVNYLWTLHEQRPHLILTVTVPELVDRHWWHRIMYEPVAGRLQRALKSLPRVVVTSVPFHLAD